MTVREVVFARDHDQCRIPWCTERRNLEWAHLAAKGMGGDHGIRTTRENTIACCHEHHRGRRSIHSGHLRWVFLFPELGADAAMGWIQYERLPKADCGLAAAPDLS